MATTVPVPFGKGLASFSIADPCETGAKQLQQDVYPNNNFREFRWWLCCLLILFFVALQGCSGDLSVLDPAGPAARSIAQIWYVMAWGSLAVLIFMVVLAVYACVRHPRPDEPTPTRRFLLGGGLLFPGAVLLALLVYGLRTGDAQAPLSGEQDTYRIEVRAHQWWWEVIHPDAPGGALHSRNEIHAPSGRPLLISITAEDVIHSFWIPRLGGKIDAIPGRVNTIRLVADEPGTYHGVCAEFCGTGHAAMSMQLHAYGKDEFDTFLSDVSEEGTNND